MFGGGGRSRGFCTVVEPRGGFYEIATPEGSLNCSLTITEVLGASEDPSGISTRYCCQLWS
jgi:hypothetical protein